MINKSLPAFVNIKLQIQRKFPLYSCRSTCESCQNASDRKGMEDHPKMRDAILSGFYPAENRAIIEPEIVRNVVFANSPCMIGTSFCEKIPDDAEL